MDARERRLPISLPEPGPSSLASSAPVQPPAVVGAAGSEPVPEGFAAVQAWIQRNTPAGPSFPTPEEGMAATVAQHRAAVAQAESMAAERKAREDGLILGKTKPQAPAPAAVAAVEAVGMEPVPEGFAEVQAWVGRNTPGASQPGPKSDVFEGFAPAVASKGPSVAAASARAVSAPKAVVAPKPTPKMEPPPERVAQTRSDSPEWFAAELVLGGALLICGLGGVAIRRSSRQARRAAEDARIDDLLESTAKGEWGEKGHGP